MSDQGRKNNLASARHPVLAQLAFHLTSLWLHREQAFAGTLGFADKIAEGQQHKEALRGM
jgi:hypothetical protein